MKRGLIMEGGAMRGMFTAGVTDVLLEHDIRFDGAIGVSAGAVFGCNFKSRQAGRAIRYNMAYCRDPRYASYRSLLTTGDLFGVQFCYEEIPQHLDPFDVETYRSNPMPFYAVCTDVATGKAVYHRCDRGDGADTLWLRASASMPMVSRIVEIDGGGYLDGCVADSIPVRAFEQMGYDRNVVILTRSASYIKKSEDTPLVRRMLRKYPQLVEAIARRHQIYNDTTCYIKAQEAAGKLFVIRPKAELNIPQICHDPSELHRVYTLGRQAALQSLDALQAYLNR